MLSWSVVAQKAASGTQSPKMEVGLSHVPGVDIDWLWDQKGLNDADVPQKNRKAVVRKCAGDAGVRVLLEGTAERACRSWVSSPSAVGELFLVKHMCNKK